MVRPKGCSAATAGGTLAAWAKEASDDLEPDIKECNQAAKPEPLKGVTVVLLDPGTGLGPLAQQAVGRAARRVVLDQHPGPEHQTGFAIDIGASPASCSLDQCFADTAHGQWLAANAHRFGFTLRYQNGMTATTGYEFEPWHYRYVGVELAAELNSLGNPTLAFLASGWEGIKVRLTAKAHTAEEAVQLIDVWDAKVRANRYALLAKLRGLFLGVADISVLG